MNEWTVYRALLLLGPSAARAFETDPRRTPRFAGARATAARARLKARRARQR